MTRFCLSCMSFILKHRVQNRRGRSHLSTVAIICCLLNEVQGRHRKQLGQKLLRERGTSPILHAQLSQMAFRVPARYPDHPWKTPAADSLTTRKTTDQIQIQIQKQRRARKMKKKSSTFKSLGEFNFEEFQIGRVAVQNLRINSEPQNYIF